MHCDSRGFVGPHGLPTLFDQGVQIFGLFQYDAKDWEDPSRRSTGHRALGVIRR
jgi:hypothetical protein